MFDCDKLAAILREQFEYLLDHRRKHVETRLDEEPDCPECVLLETIERNLLGRFQARRGQTEDCAQFAQG